MSMRCPKCGHYNSSVVDGRPIKNGYKRIRKCAKLSCSHRFETRESVVKDKVKGISKLRGTLEENADG